MKNSNNIQKSIILLVILSVTLSVLFASCGDDPVKENVPELITKLSLTFTPTTGGASSTATASDPDGEGIQDIAMDGPIVLQKNVSYALSLTLLNELANPNDPGYNVTEEVEEEGDEHIFFYGWTNNLFSSPAGNGNIDNRSDVLNYADTDADGNPIGLITNWTTISTAGVGTFRIILKHQPGLKSSTSGSDVGETDLDITFDLQIQ